MRVSCILAITMMAVTALAMTSLGSEVTPANLPRTKIRRSWYGGFMGYIQLPIKEDVEGGWRMILEFRRRIKYLEICGAQVDYVSEDKRRYYLVNETWDGVLSGGDTLRMFFEADTFRKVRGQIATIQFLPISSSSTTVKIPAGSGSPGVDTTAVWTSAAGTPTTLASSNLTSRGTSTSLTEKFTQSTAMTSLPTTASTIQTTTQPSTTASGIVCQQTCGSTTGINSEWTGNFGGELTIPITNDVTDGWTATIWFQNSVTSLQIYNAVAGSSFTTAGGDTVYTITNKSWNADLTWQSNLYLTFTASIPNAQSAQTFYAHMDGQPLCVCGA